MSVYTRMTTCADCGERLPLLSWKCTRCATPTKTPASYTTLIAAGVVLTLATIRTLAFTHNPGIFTAAGSDLKNRASTTQVMLSSEPVQTPPIPPPVASTTESPGLAPPHSAMFSESLSRVETPTVIVRNNSDDIMTLTLRDEFGRNYSTQCVRGQDGILSVPSGDYRVEVTSNDPRVLPNSGDATFRRFRRYTASFVTVPEYLAGPIHLGD
ncbi:MAG: hypothetical protein IT209_11795 [Armatimonadetes bacterium]|nr:hypothetical protein [Armatimonadota bacterium]